MARCNVPVEAGMLRLPGRCWPVAAVVLGASLLTHLFLHSGISAKRHSSHGPVLLLSFPPPPSSLADFQIYLCYKKQTEHIVAESPKPIL